MPEMTNCKKCSKPLPVTLTSCPYCNTPQSALPPIKAESPIIAGNVIITGIDISIGDMVIFMVKWAIASIPAVIILSIIAGGMLSLLSVIGHSIK